MSYAVYRPGTAMASSNTLFISLGIPGNPLGAHLWIVGGVEPDMIPQLAKLMQTNMSSICRLVGISRSTVTRKLKTKATLSISQGAQVYGVVRALDAVLSLHRNNTTKTLSWLHRPAWGLGGAVPAQLLNTSMGVQAVIGLVGRIEHGVCQ